MPTKKSYIFSPHSMSTGMASVMNWTMLLIGPSRRSKSLSWRPSIADSMLFTSPERLSFIVSAICLAVPSDFFSPLSKFWTLLMPDLNTALMAVRELVVKTSDRAAALSAVPRPSVALATSPRMAVRLLKLPFASWTLTLASPILMAPPSILFVMSLMTAPRAVPALLPLTPASAIFARRAVTVSTDCPLAARVAALCAYASDSWATDVLALLCA